MNRRITIYLSQTDETRTTEKDYRTWGDVAKGEGINTSNTGAVLRQTGEALTLNTVLPTDQDLTIFVSVQKIKAGNEQEKADAATQGLLDSLKTL